MSGPGGAGGHQDPVAALLAENAANRGDAGEAAATRNDGKTADDRPTVRRTPRAGGPRAPRRPRVVSGDAGAGGMGQPNRADGAARRFLAGLLLPLAAIGLAAVGLLIPVSGGISGTAWVTAALIAAWALCGAATSWAPERTP